MYYYMNPSLRSLFSFGSNMSEVEALKKRYSNIFTGVTSVGDLKVSEFENKSQIESYIRKVQMPNSMNYIYVYYIYNLQNEVIFVYYGTKQSCEHLYSIFGVGELVCYDYMYEAKDNLTLPTVRKVHSWYKQNSNSLLCLFNAQSLDVSKKSDVDVPKEDSYNPVKSVSLQDMRNYTEDSDFTDIYGLCKNLSESINRVVAMEKTLKEVLSICDKETSNILHRLELQFSKVNACEGYKISKELHDVRTYRRIVKDKLELISKLKESGIQDTLETYPLFVDGLGDRVYIERNTFGLFDDT